MAVRPIMAGGTVVAPPTGAAATTLPTHTATSYAAANSAVAQMNAAIRDAAQGARGQANPMPVPVQALSIQVATPAKR